MTSDEYGNIYITERYSNQVFIVTEDGARYRKLLQMLDGLFNVNGIFINTKNNSYFYVQSEIKWPSFTTFQCNYAMKTYKKK